MAIPFRLAGLLVAGLVAGCAGQPSPLEAPAAQAPAPAGQPRLKPMPIRPLQVKTDCGFKDEAGYNGSAVLEVDDARVKAFEATVHIPRRGSCHFELAGFRQVKALPHVELAGASGCTVRMWEQGDQVAVGFSQCAHHCTGNASDYLWPILVDRPSGRCD